MKILQAKPLKFPEVKVISYGRFADGRGYFTETFRKSDFATNPELDFMKGIEFFQANESSSKRGVVRGLHFQWNPYMGKLVRTITGHMVDLILDIRRNSPTFGKIIGYDLPATTGAENGEWIWIPKGFAHGNFFMKDTVIEYFCSGEYNGTCEAGISVLSKDIDWSLCDSDVKGKFDEIVSGGPMITDKDRNGFSMDGWKNDKRSENFVYQEA